MTLLGRSSDVEDVLQATNLELWAKASDYDCTRPFLAWAYRFAYLQVMAHRKRHARDRLLFDDELLGQIASEFARQDEHAEFQLEALAACLESLPPKQRELIDRRYKSGHSVTVMAAETGGDVNNVSAALYRVRKLLADCIGRRLATGVV